MKTFFSRRPATLVALCLGAFAPVLALAIPGCSGGNSILSNNNNTPSNVTIPTSVLDLGNGQTATFTLTRRGNAITGNVAINSLAVTVAAKTDTSKTEAARTAAAISFSVAPGNYPVSGTFNAPRGFSINGSIPSPIGNFSFSGQFPTQSDPGSFTLTAGGETISGPIPSLSGVIPTVGPTSSPTSGPTRAPTSAPTAGPTTTPTTSGVSRLTIKDFTKSSAFNGIGIDAGITVTGQTPTFSNATSFGASNIRIGGDNNFLFEGPVLNRPARVGDRFILGNQNASTGILYYEEPGSKGWESTSGTLEVTAAATAKTVTFKLLQVNFAPRSFGTTSAVGTFSLNSDGFFSGS